VLVAAALNQHVENLALVIDGAPQVHPLARDANDHLVEVPPVARQMERSPARRRNGAPSSRHPALEPRSTAAIRHRLLPGSRSDESRCQCGLSAGFGAGSEAKLMFPPIR
jgi:hypothetical protein